MSGSVEKVPVTLILGLHLDDKDTSIATPFIAGAIDTALGDHLDQDEWDKLVNAAKRVWTADPRDYEWREVRAEFDASALADAFRTPVVTGELA